MVVEIARDTIVRMQKGMVVDLPEEEAKRLISFGNAVEKKIEKPAPKKAVKKKED